MYRSFRNGIHRLFWYSKKEKWDTNTGTASMPSFLVSPSVNVFLIDSIATVIRKNASMCVLKGAVVDSVLMA
jgi:chemotaxis response regulator CheB